MKAGLYEARKVPPKFKHGHSGYINYRCRCDVCRDAQSAYFRERRRRNREAREAAEAEGRVFIVEGVKHGVNAYRNHGCRCDVCCAAKSVERRGEQLRRSALADVEEG